MANPTGKNQYSGFRGPVAPKGYQMKFKNVRSGPGPYAMITPTPVGYRKATATQKKAIARAKSVAKRGYSAKESKAIIASSRYS